MNKQLTDWIKSEEAQGYSEKQLRDYMQKQGYRSEDIQSAMASEKELSLKQIFKPTVLKCFFPALILILILVSFFINSAHIPAAGKLICDDQKNAEQRKIWRESFDTKLSTNNADPKEIISLLRQEEIMVMNSNSHSRALLEHETPIILGNLYLSYSMIYKLNPFFPTPCEARNIEDAFVNDNFCRYYLSKDSYDSIISSAKQESEERGALASILGSNPPAYREISFVGLLIHSIILIIVVYLIICLISLGNRKLSEQDLKTRVILNCVLILLPLLAYYIFRMEYPLLLMPLIAIFVISSLIRTEQHRKIFLYVLTIIFILLLVGGVLFIQYMMKSSYRQSEEFTAIKMKYEVKYDVLKCENTTILSLKEKQSERVDEKYLNEEWKICNNPSCYDLCKDFCKQKQSNGGVVDTMRLRGDNPSCICGCYMAR